MMAEGSTAQKQHISLQLLTSNQLANKQVKQQSFIWRRGLGCSGHFVIYRGWTMIWQAMLWDFPLYNPLVGSVLSYVVVHSLIRMDGKNRVDSNLLSPTLVPGFALCVELSPAVLIVNTGMCLVSPEHSNSLCTAGYRKQGTSPRIPCVDFGLIFDLSNTWWYTYRRYTLKWANCTALWFLVWSCTWQQDGKVHVHP